MPAFSTAFQADAFQNDAFQIAGADPGPSVTKTGGGGGSRRKRPRWWDKSPAEQAKIIADMAAIAVVENPQSAEQPPVTVEFVKEEFDIEGLRLELEAMEFVQRRVAALVKQIREDDDEDAVVAALMSMQ